MSLIEKELINARRERDELARQNADMAARLAEIEAQEPVAWVPMHPRDGALWAMTTATPSEERLPLHYPLSPLYKSPAPAAAPERDENDAVRRAVRAAVSAIYFADSADYLGALWDVVRALRPDLAELMGRDDRSAWLAVQDETDQAKPADGCGACGDACRSRGSCRLADESPKPAARPCRCRRCLTERGDLRTLASTMILCPTCGNKRCPHATDNRNACTGSNEPGQAGSWYGGMPEQTEPASMCRCSQDGFGDSVA